ncbi:adenine phosphoribosyltransferase [Kitasatospora sp. NPDC059673]|uniref:adenine phosphoribosyltransferase n=1 Tax=Kitasatospora sp. NPDC059673 TaxID=3346901 RepID=UPI0036D17C7F
MASIEEIDDKIRTLLLERITDVSDHPRPGVVFKDITPLLADPDAFGPLVDVLARFCVAVGADKVAGLEARGFILAAPVALRAGLGFVPIRKAGKLPGPTLAQGYELEYGAAEVEIQRSAFAPGERVVVVDDVLATGGTLDASLGLLRRAGAEVAGVAVLLELGFLAGRSRLTPALGEAPLEAVLTV